MDLIGRIAQSNGRLKAAGVKVRIEQDGQSLRLRATLPPKPGSHRTEWYQQRIYPRLGANPAHLKLAEREARTIGALIAQSRFSWEPYLRGVPTRAQPVGDLVKEHRAKHLANGGRADTWHKEYGSVFARLPQDAPLSVDITTKIVKATKENTKSRLRACAAMTNLCKLAGVEIDLKPLRGNYNSSKTSLRDIPTDESVIRHYWTIKSPGWRWVYGMMATYGLRNHEAFKLDLAQFPVIQVLEDTKTGFREVWPCYPEWAEEWELDKMVLPRIDLSRTNEKIGRSVSIFLSPRLPFLPYDLRHAWAIRTIYFGWPDALAAAQMGHSTEIHSRTYHRWLSNRDHQKIYDLLVMRPDRPRPPIVPKPGEGCQDS